MSENKRYKTDNFHASSLENNPLRAPTNRDLHIYLPPDYYEGKKNYPVVYFLHGYSVNNHRWTITHKNSKYRNIPWEIIPKKTLKKIDIERLTTFEKLDNQISLGELEPFILVQPDGSLHEPHIEGRKDLNGEVLTKGSFYVNSPYTGNYSDYIVKDVIKYIDSNYRTIPNRNNRALMGGSMGGFGTLYLTLLYPNVFISAAALSPANLGKIELLDWELRIPIYAETLGEKMGKEIGKSTWKDIFDTLDLIFSKENPLIPTIEKEENGNIKDYDQEAYENWQQYDLNNVIKKHPKALKHINLLIKCEKGDEFGLTEGTKKIHEILDDLNIEHQFDLYTDPRASLSPHILGIGYNILPGIKHCCKFFQN